jgi:hypothetical protein
MPNEMNHAEVADFLDGLADGYEFDSQGEEDYHTRWIKKLRQASSDERRIANKELVFAPVGCWECYFLNKAPCPARDRETGDTKNCMKYCSNGIRKDDNHA